VRYLDGPRPRLFAHRGASGTFPENTIESFRAGLEAGAARLELDVHASADGHVVVFHGGTHERPPDGEGLLRERTLDELRLLDAGFRFTDERGGHPFRGRGVRIPTLAELLEACPGVPLNIEVKHDDGTTVEAVLDVLDRFDARGRVLLAAYEDPIMHRIREVAPEAATSLSAAEVAQFVTAFLTDSLAGYRAPGCALQVPPAHEGIDIVTADTVRAAHGLGMEVHVWTINDEAEMRRLLALGVDALMSDFPGRARAVMGEAGQRR
jgi:glycerophosphoryl diester phosphodiesterase